MSSVFEFLRELWIRLARLVFWKRNDSKYIVLLGAPGAGKGTIASMLKEKLGLPQLQTGQLIRTEIESGSPLGKALAPMVAAGAYISDEIIIKLFKQELRKPEYVNGAILDGIPRTVEQALSLRRTLLFWGNKVNRVVLLDIAEEDVVERILLRRTCSSKACGASFHLKFAPPASENVCDYCGSRLKQRSDDNEKTIRERLRVFNESSGPLRDFYKASKLLTVVKTSNKRSPEEVLRDVIFTIEQFD